MRERERQSEGERLINKTDVRLKENREGGRDEEEEDEEEIDHSIQAMTATGGMDRSASLRGLKLDKSVTDSDST